MSGFFKFVLVSTIGLLEPSRRRCNNLVDVSTAPLQRSHVKHIFAIAVRRHPTILTSKSIRYLPSGLSLHPLSTNNRCDDASGQSCRCSHGEDVVTIVSKAKISLNAVVAAPMMRCWHRCYNNDDAVEQRSPPIFG
ncbi:Hypothetical predicted protein [Olea europaea subsp. europaea]|uniref:Uncharacterized protein n=1 Tax=Olea europaea subsp. europaea TaxID=158383 RepID=A0A8S0VLF8_OLEEU|nr:Hypothetical predicted protein [Olea europaea subsp. europaea]